MNKRTIAPAFTDDRGTIADVFYAEEINHVAVIHSTTGALRGNHYHRKTTQHTYVTSGAMRYFWQPLDESQPVQHVDLTAGDLVTSGPDEVHAMIMLEPTVMMVFSTGLRGGKDYEADTVRKTIATGA